MKIGIVTFVHAYNFGAALQAYALQKEIEKIGYLSELVDYRCLAIEKMHSFLPVFSTNIRLKARVYNFIFNIVFFPRRVKFESFRKMMKISTPFTRENIAQISDRYDCYITGSDQVFNLQLTGNDTTYLLDFVDDSKIRASFAASVGTFKEENIEIYNCYLSKFNYITLREKSTARIMTDRLKFDVDVMPDPVFLHSDKEWSKLLKLKKTAKKNYLLIYALSEDSNLYIVAEKIAKENNLKIIVLTKALKPKGKATRYIRNAGPKEFMNLIYDADYIVTNSFHGIAFSTIFNKQFITVLPKSAPERIIDLLGYLNLNERIYDCRNTPIKAIEYDNVNPLLKNLRDKGECFLKTIVSKESKL